MGPLALALLVLLSACGSRMPAVIGQTPLVAPPPTDKTEAPKLSGHVRKSDGTLLDLAAGPDRPRVVIFAQDSCSVCRAETKDLVKYLAGSPPANVDIVTVLVGAELEDAQDWASDLKVPWTVAIDQPENLMTNFCGPTRQVPCSLVQMPGQGIVLTKIGRVTVDELQSITGGWK